MVTTDIANMLIELYEVLMEFIENKEQSCLEIE